MIGLGQSTQGTKAILVDSEGEIVAKAFLPHEQIISPEGWVSHDGEEIFHSCVHVIRQLIEDAAVNKSSIAAIGIFNQRETTIAWDRETGKPAEHAIVWQRTRAKKITDGIPDEAFRKSVREKTGIPFFPYFPAAKAAWILRYSEKAAALDVSSQAQILHLLAGICRESHTSAIFVSHDLAVIRCLCDRVMILRGGALVEERPTAQVIRQPRGLYEKAGRLGPGNQRLGRCLMFVFREGGACEIEGADFSDFFQISSPRGASARRGILLCSFQIRCLIGCRDFPRSTCLFHISDTKAAEDLSCYSPPSRSLGGLILC